MISSILLLGGIGFLAALILGISAVTFAVKMDPREKEVLDQLPGANCGACGFAGCAAFAHEITVNPDAQMACPAVNEAALEAISGILGRSLGGSAPLIACIRCKGAPAETTNRYGYVGRRTAGPRRSWPAAEGCQYGCLLRNLRRGVPLQCHHHGRDGLPM